MMVRVGTHRSGISVRVRPWCSLSPLASVFALKQSARSLWRWRWAEAVWRYLLGQVTAHPLSTHTQKQKTPHLQLEDCTQAWGENTDHLFFPWALTDHPAPWHHPGYNSLTGCSSLRLHTDHKRNSLCLGRRWGDSAVGSFKELFPMTGRTVATKLLQNALCSETADGTHQKVTTEDGHGKSQSWMTNSSKMILPKIRWNGVVSTWERFSKGSHRIL